MEETWEYHVFKGKASPLLLATCLNWFLLICSGSLWIMVNWLISSALERTDVYTAVESTARQLPAPCPRPEVIPAFTESLLQPTHMKFTGHRC